MRTRPLLRWAPAIAWAAALLVLGSRSGEELPSGPAGFDKLVHMALYCVLGALVARAAGRWAVAAAAALLVGAVDEWVVQAAAAGRTPDWMDLLADVAGAALGGWILLRFARRPGRS